MFLDLEQGQDGAFWNTRNGYLNHINMYSYYAIIIDLHVNVCDSAHCCGCVVDNNVAMAAYC